MFQKIKPALITLFSFILTVCVCIGIITNIDFKANAAELATAPAPQTVNTTVSPEPWAGSIALRWTISNSSTLNEQGFGGSHDAGYDDIVSKIHVNGQAYTGTVMVMCNTSVYYYVLYNLTPAEGMTISLKSGLPLMETKGSPFAATASDYSYVYTGGEFVVDEYNLSTVQAPEGIDTSSTWGTYPKIMFNVTNSSTLNEQGFGGSQDAGYEDIVSNILVNGEAYTGTVMVMCNSDVYYYVLLNQQMTEGMTITLKVGLKLFESKGTPFAVLSEEVTYEYNGSAFIRKIEVPDAPMPVGIGTASTWGALPTIMWNISNTSNLNEQGFGGSHDAGYEDIVSNILVNGEAYTGTVMVMCNSDVYYYVLLNQQMTEGMTITLKAGLKLFESKGTPFAVLSEDVTYEYDGTSFDLKVSNAPAISCIETTSIWGAYPALKWDVNNSSGLNWQGFGGSQDAGYENITSHILVNGEAYTGIVMVACNSEVYYYVLINQAMTQGTKITVKAGLRLFESKGVPFAKIDKDYTYVYIDGAFIEFTGEPTEMTLEIADGSSDLLLTTLSKTINVSFSPLGSWVTPTFTSSNDEVATVDANGKVTGVSAGNVDITVQCGSLEETVSFRVLEKGSVSEIEIKNNYTVYIIKGEDFSAFPSKRYATPIYGSGDSSVEGDEFEIVIGDNLILPADFNTDTVGEYALDCLVSFEDEQYPVEIVVNVYELYDQEPSGIPGIYKDWNYNMLLAFGNTMTNNTTYHNVPKGTTDGVVYTRADGTVVQTGIIVTGVHLLLCVPFADGSLNDDNVIGEPYYIPGDILTFKKGMEFYKFTGEVDSNGITDDTTGMFVLEGTLSEDYVYVLNEDGVWEFYKEYTDVTVLNETVEVVIGRSVNVGALRVPTNATTGTFTYEVGDDTVCSVSSVGIVKGLKVGTTKITITLDGGEAGRKVVEITLNVVDAVTGIKLSTTETTVSYKGDLEFDNITATTVYASGKDGEAVDLTKAVVSGFDSSKVGVQTVTLKVTIDGEIYSAKIKVTVEAEKGCGGAIASCGLLGASTLIAFSVFGFIKKKEK